MAGILMGTALLLTGDEPFIGAALGLCGLMAGLTRRLGRPASALAFALGNTLTILYGMSYLYGAIHPAAALGIGCAYCLMPAPLEKKIVGWFSKEAANDDPDKLVRRIRKSAQLRVQALGSVFSELAEGYSAEDTQTLPDEQELVAQMRARLCSGCLRYQDCWDGTDQRAGRMLCGLLGAALKGEPLKEDVELPPEVNRVCVRGNAIPRRLGGMLCEFDERRRAMRARGESKMIIARQFRQAQELLFSAGDLLGRPMNVDADVTRLVAAALDREGLCVEEVFAFYEEGLEITVTLKDRLWTEGLSDRAASRLTKTLGTPIKHAWIRGVGDRQLRFYESPKLTACVGVARAAAVEGAPCGDHHTVTGLPGGRLLLALSDGMGTGETAARESESAIRLIRRFLAADVKRELALNMINDLLLMVSGEDMFATVDLCVIDLNSGRTEINKLGACATVILREGKVMRVEGGRLPLGILSQVKPVNRTVRLKPDDLLIMVTDGMAETARDGDQAWLEARILEVAKMQPQALCDALLRAAQSREGRIDDDRTVMAVRIDRAVK